MIDRVRVTVCWCEEAEAELAGIYLSVADSDKVVAAAYEVDELLRVDPSRKGLSISAETLDAESIEKLGERIGDTPANLRQIRVGPLRIFFTAHEEDRQVRVWLAAANS